MSSSSSSTQPPTPNDPAAPSSLVVEVGPGTSGDQVAAAIAAAGVGLSEAGKAKLMEEVTRALLEEGAQSGDGPGKLEPPEPARDATAAATVEEAVSGGSAQAAPKPPAAALAEPSGGGSSESESHEPFRLPGELPPGREQEEAEEVMRLLFEHLKTAEGQAEFYRLVQQYDAEDTAKAQHQEKEQEGDGERESGGKGLEKSDP